MKKSSVINVILEIFEDNRVSSSFTDITKEKLAEEILDALENIGMKPPRDSLLLREIWDIENDCE